MRGTDTGTTVLDGLVRDGELGEVVADHLGLDLDGVELLAGVDADDGADHLGDDDHVAEVRLDGVGLLVGLGLLLRLAELLDQTHGLALQAAVEPATGTGVDDIAELLAGKVEEPGGGRKVSGRVRGADLVWYPQDMRVALTRQGRFRGRRTCGTLSSSSALYNTIHVSRYPIFQRPFSGLGPQGFQPRATLAIEHGCGGGGGGVRVPAASSAFCKYMLASVLGVLG